MQIFDASINKVVLVNKIEKTDAEWKQILTPEQYKVTTKKGTEAPFSCALNEAKENGIYECVRCGTALFFSDAKFDSGTGWPSYYNPVSPLNIRIVEDDSLGMVLNEVLCARCGSHLGHLFDDGPFPSYKRFCINGIALKFVKSGDKSLEQATFGAGCFWHIQEEFDKVKGVVNTEVGFAGGTVPEPSYEKVCGGTTGHAEVVHIKFDPKKVSYDQLLDVFWKIHDPTTVNRQGPDVGEQYRSAIFYYSPEQKEAAIKSKEKIEKAGKFKRPIVTQIIPSSKFFRAEEYHQEYYKKKK